MIILTIRTDKPEAELGLYENNDQLEYEVWAAHRQLAESIHGKIQELLGRQQKSWHDLEGIVCFQGPGSFTGLRIGLSVGNALAYGLKIPIVAAQEPNWLEWGIARLRVKEDDGQALPFYGSEAHITPQKK